MSAPDAERTGTDGRPAGRPFDWDFDRDFDWDWDRNWDFCYDRIPRAGSSVVEHLTFNQVVVGSIPARLTKKIKEL